MPCRICQQPLPPDANFCPACGARVAGAATGPTQRLSPALPQVCPKCGGVMEAGFIPDEFRDRNEVTVWVRGEPERDREGAVILEGSSMWRVAPTAAPIAATSVVRDDAGQIENTYYYSAMLKLGENHTAP